MRGSAAQAPFPPIWLALLFVASGHAHAAELKLDRSISLGQEYNTNIRLTRLPHESVWLTRLTPALKLTSQTEIASLVASGRLNLNNYANDEDLNRVDQYYSVDGNLRTERNLYGMSLGYTADSTLQTELEETGVVQNRLPRRSFVFRPSYTRLIDERTSLQMDYQFSTVRYSGGETVLNDFSNQTASVSGTHQWTEQAQLSLTGYLGRYETDDGDVRADTYGLQGGLGYAFDETLTASIAAGYRQTQLEVEFLAFEGCGDGFLLNTPFGPVCLPPGAPVFARRTRETDSNGTLFSASLNKKFYRATLSANASRTLNPSGQGRLVETDRLGFRFDHRFSERLAAALTVDGYRSDFISETQSSEVRYYRIEPSFAWRLTEEWRLSSGLRYAQYSIGSSANDTDAKSVYVNVTYEWPEWSDSR